MRIVDDDDDNGALQYVRALFVHSAAAIKTSINIRTISKLLGENMKKYLILLRTRKRTSSLRVAGFVFAAIRTHDTAICWRYVCRRRLRRMTPDMCTVRCVARAHYFGFGVGEAVVVVGLCVVDSGCCRTVGAPSTKSARVRMCTCRSASVVFLCLPCVSVCCVLWFVCVRDVVVWVGVERVNPLTDRTHKTHTHTHEATEQRRSSHITNAVHYV